MAWETWLGYVACYVLGLLSLYLYRTFAGPSSPLSGGAGGGPAMAPPLGPAAGAGLPPPPPPPPAAAGLQPRPTATTATASASADGSVDGGGKQAKKAKKAPTTMAAASPPDSPLKRSRSAGKGQEDDRRRCRRQKEERSVAAPSSSSSTTTTDDEDDDDSGASETVVTARKKSSGKPKRDKKDGPATPASSSSSSPALPSPNGHGEHELRALRADVESLKQSLAAATSSSLSSSLPSAATRRAVTPADPATGLRASVSDTMRLTQVQSPSSFGPMDPYVSTLPIHKKGWLELRTFKMFNRRYFMLHGNWLTYFKDDKMRRGECYGHICLQPSCQVKEIATKERCFKLESQSKESLFRVRGPGINAATTHRMMHAAASKVILRADLQQQTSEWVASIQFICQLLNSPSYQGQYVVDDSSSGIGLSDEGWEEDGYTSEIAHETNLKQSRGKRGAAMGANASPTFGRTATKRPISISNTEEIWKKQAKDSNAFTSDAMRSTGRSQSASGSTDKPTRRLHRRGGSEDDEEEAREGSKNSGSSEEDIGNEDEVSSTDDADGSVTREIEPVADEYDYQWPQEQMTAVESLKAELGPKYQEENCNMFMLWRFLKARTFDVPLAHQMINEYFAWRKQYRPEEIQASEVSDEIALGKALFIGYDLQRRPILLCYPSRHDPKTSTTDHFMRYVCFLIETAIRRMKPPVQQFTCIVDLQGFGMANADSNMAKTAAHMLQSYYPERLGVMVAVNCGLVLNVAWRMVKSLLDERTKNKIHFQKGTKDLLKLGIFDPDTIPVQYGGNANLTLPPGSYGLELL